MPEEIHVPSGLLTRIGERQYQLDLRGYSCPYPQLYAVAALKSLEVGSVLEILIDNPPSCETVPRSIRNSGQEYLGTEKIGSSLWVIRARRSEAG